ncbi:hypothetical protein F971_03202 [Acinetobacter vivianii]|uniref:Uncharacterized protein n=1 Tax=Acinetobacter vivianii TaxID=1776742 RepID=N8UV67_9GAMM|nr:hypothetical protein F971_03202 [Acinetobacter vivianii]
MQSHTHTQNSLNDLPLLPYTSKLNPPLQQVEVGTRSKRNLPNHVQNKQLRKSKAPVAKRLANTKQLNYQQWLDVRKQGIGCSDRLWTESLYVDARVVDN